MIHMIERQKRVERCIDGGGHLVLTERAQRVETDHFVFIGFAAVTRDEGLELVEMQEREAGRADAAQIAAAALHREHPHGRARQRIRQVDLRARVAAAEVRDAKIGAQQVRSVAQQLERLPGQTGGLVIVPQVPQKLCFDRYGFGHNVTPGRIMLHAKSWWPLLLHTAKRVRLKPDTTDVFFEPLSLRFGSVCLLGGRQRQPDIGASR